MFGVIVSPSIFSMMFPALIFDVALSADELASRKAAWKAPPLKFNRGTLYKYIKNVKTATEGCVTDEETPKPPKGDFKDFKERKFF